MTVLAAINKIIKEDYPQIKQKITPSTKLKDVKELDSLELAIIIIKLETIFDIRIDDNKILALQTKTLQDLINEFEVAIKAKIIS